MRYSAGSAAQPRSTSSRSSCALPTVILGPSVKAKALHKLYNSKGFRVTTASEVIDGCPTFATAYVGRKRWAERNDRFRYLWNDRRLDVVGPILQATQHRFEVRQLRPAGDVFAALESPARQQIKGLPARGWRVMETRLERDVVVVQPIGIDLHFGPGRTAAKKVNRSPAPNHIDSPLPGKRSSHRFDRHIRPPMIR